MSKAAELAALIGGQKALGDKNFIINGDMQCWQRATAATAANNYGTVDRWAFGEGTDGAYTSEQSTDTPTGTGFSIKAQVTTADTSLASSQYAYIYQEIEAQNLQSLQYGTSSAKTLTLSFWVKSNKTGTYTISIQKRDATVYYLAIEYTIDSANTWEKKTITISPTAGSTSFITASAGAIANDNGQGIQLGFGLAWGSQFNGATNNTWTTSTYYATSNHVNWMDSTSNNFYLAQVQLEIGDVATAFEHEDFGTTLAKCQRYYYQTTTIGSSGVHYNLIGRISSTTQGYYTQELPTNLRTTPSIAANPAYNTGSSWHNNLSGVDNKAWSGAPVIGACSNNVVTWYVTTAAWASGYVGMVTQPYTPTSVSSNYISYDAEL